MVRTNAADALPIQLARVDWADYLPGDDEALHVRQVIAHDVFGEELWADERVRAFFAPWFAEFARILSTIDARTENTPGEAFGKLYREMAEPLANLCARTLVVPPWTSIDLLRRFVAESSSRITGENVWLRAAIEYVKPAAINDYEATFRICKGITAEEALHALEEFNARVIVETGMVADGEPTRRKPMPKNGGKELERDTRWYFRAVIRREPINAIARRDGVKRPTVQQAIKRVHPLVDIWVLPAPGRAAATGTRRKQRPSARKTRPRQNQRRAPRR